MVLIRTNAHTTGDGTLSLTVETQLPDTEVEVTMTLDPKLTPAVKTYPAGFIEATYGSIRELQRLPQGNPDLREPWP